MPNNYFQFKQFTIHQDQCAMKVCTDACILGAWFAAKVPDIGYFLDIGSGTGLLMMMLAQKTNAEIHGIEIDLAAFKQLKDNINQNLWKERLRVFPGDARTYRFPVKYDFIITNPPFFDNDLPSESEEEKIAKHSKHLDFEELLEVINHHLQPYGGFGILIPYQRLEEFEKLAAQKGFYCTEELLVRQTPKHNPFRAILHYARAKENFVPRFELIIQDEQNKYTPEFAELMKDYYLYL